MTRHLSPTTYLAEIGDDLVVLDAAQNAYFCLPAAASSVRTGPHGVTFGDPDLAAEFEAARFLADTPHPARRSAPSPTRDLGLRVADRLRLRDALLILAAWATMLVSYHARDFHRLVTTARRRRGSVREVLTGEMIDLVAAFERLLPWLPFQGVCLYRSFLLLRVLRWRGYDARWVFGVRTWPFGAHCWLQVEDVVLDDTADRLAGYTAIMVV